MIRWTDRLLAICKEELGKRAYGDVKGAVDPIRKRSKQPVTLDAINRVFARRGVRAPITFTGKGSRDPVARLEQRDDARAERQAHEDMLRELREHRKRQAILEASGRAYEPPKVLPRERSAGAPRELVGVVLASDWHVEETVDPETVMGRNAYDLAIADRRIERFFRGIIWQFEHHRASKRLAIRDLVLWLGGDLMSGYIHEELVEGNSLSPTETMLWLMPRLRNGITTLLETLSLERLIVPCSFGNHGRTTQRIRISTGAANSFEWLMYCQLRDSMPDKRITWEITTSAHQYVQAYDWTLHFTHGDSLKYAGGVGGLGIPYLKAIPAWNVVRPAHVHHIGHFHQLLDYGSGFVNGSLIGYGPYSLRIKAPYEAPQQLMYFIDRKRGRCMPTALWCAE